MKNKNSYFICLLLALGVSVRAHAEILTVEGDLNVVAVEGAANGDLHIDGNLTVGNIFSIDSDNYSVSWGARALGVSGSFSTAWGFLGEASGDYSTVWGRHGEASGDTSTAWGVGAHASGSLATAWGYNNYATGNFATAWGHGVLANSKLSTAFGEFNVGGFYDNGDGISTNDGDVTWFDSDSIFEIGIGRHPSGRANALTVMKSGTVLLGRHDGAAISAQAPETLQVQGPVLIGQYLDANGVPIEPATPSAGAIRYNGSDFEGYVDDGVNPASWVSLVSPEAASAASALVIPQTTSAVLSVEAITGTISMSSAQGDISMGAFGVPAQ